METANVKALLGSFLVVSKCLLTDPSQIGSSHDSMIFWPTPKVLNLAPEDPLQSLTHLNQLIKVFKTA